MQRNSKEAAGVSRLSAAPTHRAKLDSQPREQCMLVPLAAMKEEGEEAGGGGGGGEVTWTHEQLLELIPSAILHSQVESPEPKKLAYC